MSRTRDIRIYSYMRDYLDEVLTKFRKVLDVGLEYDTLTFYQKLDLLLDKYDINYDELKKILHFVIPSFSKLHSSSDLKQKTTVKNANIIAAVRTVKNIIREYYESQGIEVPYTDLPLNTLAIYTIVQYYLVHILGENVDTTISQGAGEEAEEEIDFTLDVDQLDRTTYWKLVNDERTGLPYNINTVGTLIVSVENFEPKQPISGLDLVDDRNGYIYDFIFLSAVMTAASKNLLNVDRREVIYLIDKHLYNLYSRHDPDALNTVGSDFEDRFIFFQNLLVKMFEDSDEEGRKLLKKKMDRLVYLFNHLVYIDFRLSVEATSMSSKKSKSDPRKIHSYSVLNHTPGTHWVFGSFVSYLPSEKKILGGGFKLIDTVIFNPVAMLDETNPLITFPPLINHNPRLYDIFASKATSTGDLFLLLVRTENIPSVSKRSKKKEDENAEEIDDIEAKFEGAEHVKTVNYLLAAIPMNPIVMVSRQSNSLRKRVKNIKEIFGFDEPPEKMDDVLTSLYLLSRAYLPDYKHYDIEGRSLLGWDQYLGMIFSTLTFLSPTRIFSTISQELDTRIHTLLYGFKGTGKSMVIRRFTEELHPGSTVYIDPSQNSTLAGLIGGIEYKQIGRLRVPIYTSGSLMKADGSMVGVDEILELPSDILLLISYIMSSYTLPKRHIRFNLNTESIKFYASTLAAANPRNEMQMYLLYLLHPEMIISFEKTHLSSVLALLEKVTGNRMDESMIANIKSNPEAFLKSTIMSSLTDRMNLPDDLKHLVNMTAYDQAQSDFYKQSLSKIFDRFTFVVPMYSKAGSVRDEKFDKSYLIGDRIYLYDPLLGGGEHIALDDLRAFSNFTQTYSPVYTGNDEDIVKLKRLYSDSIDVMNKVYAMIDEKISKAVKASGTASDAAALLVRHAGHRFTTVAYRMAHTILKLYDMDKPNKAIWEAIEYLVTNYVRIAYLNPLGVTLGRIGESDYVRLVLNTLKIRAEEKSRDSYVVITPQDAERVAKELLSDKQVYLTKYDVPLSYTHSVDMAVRIVKALAGDIDDPKADYIKILDKIVSGDNIVYRYEKDSDAGKLLTKATIEVQKYRNAYRIYLVLGNAKVKIMEVMP